MASTLSTHDNMYDIVELLKEIELVRNTVDFNNIVNTICRIYTHNTNNNVALENEFIIDKIAKTHNYQLCIHLLKQLESVNIIGKIVANEWIYYYMSCHCEQNASEIAMQFNNIVEYLPSDTIVTMLCSFAKGNIDKIHIVDKLTGWKIYEHKYEFFIEALNMQDIAIASYVYNLEKRPVFMIVYCYICYVSDNDIYVEPDFMEWLVTKYSDTILPNLSSIIGSLMNQNTICSLLDILNVNKLLAHRILCDAIIMNNAILFDAMVSKYFKDVTPEQMFKKICSVLTPTCIVNEIFLYIFDQCIFTANDLDKTFISLCKRNCVNIINWFTTYFPNKFKKTYSNSIEITNNMLVPICDMFYIVNKFIILDDVVTGECCICYNTDELVKLNCHDTHTVCASCMKKLYTTSDQCPICRMPLILSQCALQLKL